MTLVKRMSAAFLLALFAGSASAQEARVGIREGGRTIGAGQVIEILDRVGIREGGRTIGAGQVTEILDRTAGGRAGGRDAKDERGAARGRNR